MIKVMHVITTLGPAGAETMLCRIASRMDGTRFENEVVSLTGAWQGGWKQLVSVFAHLT